MSDRSKFQKFLDRKFKIEESREKTLIKEVDGLELVFKRDSKLERKAYSIFKGMFKEMSTLDKDIQFNMAFVFTEECLNDVIELMYDSCITLQDSELQKELGIKIPERIIEAIFTTDEIFSIGFDVVMFLIGQGEEKQKEIEKK